MNLSVVICTLSDMRIQNTINSINNHCEIVVVCNGSTKDYEDWVHNLLQKKGFEYKLISIPEKNLSKARDIGTEESKYDKVVHIDTDCIFTDTALKEFEILLEKNLLVDGKKLFLYNNKESKIVSTMRSMGLPGLMLCPSIGINKKIKPLIGNHFFNQSIKWIEDSEFNCRVKKANIGFVTTKNITCKHSPISFKQDLNSAKNYGSGVKIAYKIGRHKKGPDANWFLLKEMKKFGFSYWFYALIWNLAYCKGYFLTKFKGDGNE